MRRLLDASKGGDESLMARTEELQRQVEASMMVQKSLLAGVKDLSEENSALCEQLQASEACRLELEDRLRTIQQAGSRLVLHGLYHVTLLTRMWALQRWYQVTSAEKQRRSRVAHLKKLSLLRWLASQRLSLQEIFQAWHAESAHMPLSGARAHTCSVRHVLSSLRGRSLSFSKCTFHHTTILFNLCGG